MEYKKANQEKLLKKYKKRVEGYLNDWNVDSKQYTQITKDP